MSLSSFVGLSVGLSVCRLAVSFAAFSAYWEIEAFETFYSTDIHFADIPGKFDTHTYTHKRARTYARTTTHTHMHAGVLWTGGRPEGSGGGSCPDTRRKGFGFRCHFSRRRPRSRNPGNSAARNRRMKHTEAACDAEEEEIATSGRENEVNEWMNE